LPAELIAAEDDILDTGVLAELRDMASGSQAIVDRIIDLYASQSSACLRDLAEALKNNNLDQFGRAAHALKSMSYNVGARRIAQLAGEFENAARIENRIVAPTELETLGLQMIETSAALEKQRKMA
jgi:HPt (histidine-containing phosphotransfer) domain-containing protein